MTRFLNVALSIARRSCLGLLTIMALLAAMAATQFMCRRMDTDQFDELPFLTIDKANMTSSAYLVLWAGMSILFVSSSIACMTVPLHGALLRWRVFSPPWHPIAAYWLIIGLVVALYYVEPLNAYRSTHFEQLISRATRIHDPHFPFQAIVDLCGTVLVTVAYAFRVDMAIAAAAQGRPFARKDLDSATSVASVILAVAIVEVFALYSWATSRLCPTEPKVVGEGCALLVRYVTFCSGAMFSCALVCLYSYGVRRMTGSWYWVRAADDGKLSAGMSTLVPVLAGIAALVAPK